MTAHARDSGHLACAGQILTANEERLGLVLLVEDWRASSPSGDFGRDWVLTAIYDGSMFTGTWRFAKPGYTVVDDRRNITLGEGKQPFFIGTFKLKRNPANSTSVELKGTLIRPLGKDEKPAAGAGQDRSEAISGTLPCLDFST